MHGALVIDKPAGLTSHDVVDRIRRRLAVKKAGHAGTLDPLATGVLPVLVGRATRLIRFLPLSPKEYSGVIRLGWETDTGDAEGAALAAPRAVEIDAAAVAAAMRDFVGVLDQIPPAYSAKKVGGVAAHRLARRGVDVALAPARVEVHAFRLVRFDPPRVEFHVACSSGTYVRSLARDLGRRLGVGGHLAALRRERAGIFGLEQAVTLEAARPDDLWPPERLLAHLPRLEVDDDDESRVRRGLPAATDREAADLCIFNKQGELVAVAAAEKGWAHPRVVLL